MDPVFVSDTRARIGKVTSGRLADRSICYQRSMWRRHYCPTDKCRYGQVIGGQQEHTVRSLDRGGWNGDRAPYQGRSPPADHGVIVPE